MYKCVYEGIWSHLEDYNLSILILFCRSIFHTTSYKCAYKDKWSWLKFSNPIPLYPLTSFNFPHQHPTYTSTAVIPSFDQKQCQRSHNPIPLYHSISHTNILRIRQQQPYHHVIKSNANAVIKFCIKNGDLGVALTEMCQQREFCLHLLSTFNGFRRCTKIENND